MMIQTMKRENVQNAKSQYLLSAIYTMLEEYAIVRFSNVVLATKSTGKRDQAFLLPVP